MAQIDLLPFSDLTGYQPSSLVHRGNPSDLLLELKDLFAFQDLALQNVNVMQHVATIAKN